MIYSILVALLSAYLLHRGQKAKIWDLAAVMAIVIFGVWGPGYTAQAFIYFQF